MLCKLAGLYLYGWMGKTLILTSISSFLHSSPKVAKEDEIRPEMNWVRLQKDKLWITYEQKTDLNRDRAHDDLWLKQRADWWFRSALPGAWCREEQSFVYHNHKSVLCCFYLHLFRLLICLSLHYNRVSQRQNGMRIRLIVIRGGIDQNDKDKKGQVTSWEEE